MDIQVQKDEHKAVLALAGKLDAVTAQDFDKAVGALIEGGTVRLILDCSRLDYLSSAGLRALLMTAKRIKAKGGQLRVAGMHGAAREVFEISGFHMIFVMDDSVDAAVSALV